MKSPVIPQSYEQWRHCITVECGLVLSGDYIKERIEALNDEKNHYTQQFIKLYGSEYHSRVIAWFEHARQNQ